MDWGNQDHHVLLPLDGAFVRPTWRLNSVPHSAQLNTTVSQAISTEVAQKFGLGKCSAQAAFVGAANISWETTMACGKYHFHHI